MRARLAVMRASAGEWIDLRDILCVGGLAALAYGVSLIHVPAAWIVCGAVVFWIGIRG